MPDQKPVLNYLPPDPSARRWMMFRRIGGTAAAIALGVIALAAVVLGVTLLCVYYWYPDEREGASLGPAMVLSICGIALVILAARLVISALRSKARATFSDRL